MDVTETGDGRGRGEVISRLEEDMTERELRTKAGVGQYRSS